MEHNCVTFAMVVEVINFGNQALCIIDVSFADAEKNGLFRKKRSDKKNLDDCPDQRADIDNAPHLIIFVKTWLMGQNHAKKSADHTSDTSIHICECPKSARQ